MAGSASEERLRAKVEAAMRRRWPSARIVHELQLEQGVTRIDLAAIGEDFLAVAEIKGERDVLKRLPAQITRAAEVADEVWLAIAAKHETKVNAASLYGAEAKELGFDRAASHALWRTNVVVERNPEAEALENLSSYPRRIAPRAPDPRARFDLLWAGEMRSALGRHFGGATISTGGLTRDRMIELAVEHMTGRELRRAVCAQLRDRTFPRADERASLIEPVKSSDLYRPEPEPQATPFDAAWHEQLDQLAANPKASL